MNTKNKKRKNTMRVIGGEPRPFYMHPTQVGHDILTAATKAGYRKRDFTEQALILKYNEAVKSGALPGGINTNAVPA